MTHFVCGLALGVVIGASGMLLLAALMRSAQMSRAEEAQAPS